MNKAIDATRGTEEIDFKDKEFSFVSECDGASVLYIAIFNSSEDYLINNKVLKEFDSYGDDSDEASTCKRRFLNIF